MLRWYQMKLASRPLLTQSITSAVLFACGDTMAQQLIEKNGIKNHDLNRTRRMAIYGSAFGPVATIWFRILQQKIVLRNRNLEILARLASDQTLFAGCNLFCFICSMAIMEGSDPIEKLRANYTSALTTSWIIWPFLQFVNFKYVPLQHRVLLVNTASLGWNCYLSSLACSA